MSEHLTSAANESPTMPEYNRKLLQKIEADGNCLFKAISFCLYASQDEYKIVQDRIFEHILQHWEEFQFFIIGDESYNTPINNIDDYRNQISADSILGGDVELTVAATIFNLHICVHRSLEDDLKTAFGSENNRQISLLYTADGEAGHYDVILDGPDSSKQHH